MSTDALLLIAYVLLAIFFSFLCSVAEAVLLSITPSYIEEQKEINPKRAALLKRLKQDKVDRSLAAILTLNTIAHTVGAIGAGAKATVVFGSAWFGIFSAVMTLMILFLSEILPKTIGALYWPKLTGPAAFFVQSLIVILYPIVWISEQMTKISNSSALSQ
jgi:Mg2+/Co2+ transporter CorB